MAKKTKDQIPEVPTTAAQDMSKDSATTATTSKPNGKPQGGKPQNGKPGRGGKPNDAQSNHISWYVPDSNMLTGAASIPFNYRTGDTLSTTGSLWTMPGIVSVGFMPTYGDMQNPNDAINQAATAVYSWIRHANSGSRNYDATDLMLYLMAMDSIYMGILHCQRMLATAQLYARESRYTPTSLLNAMGLYTDGSTFFGELNEFRLRLNNIILKATTLAVPSAFPIYSRHAFMTLNVYTDEPNAWAQYYVFKPTLLYKFTLDAEGKGCLAPVDWTIDRTDETVNVRTWRDYVARLDDMLNQVYGDEDTGIMSGDILKAYGEGGLVKLATIAPDVTVGFRYDVEMLNQIHNATIAGAPDFSGEHNYIVQVIEESPISGTFGFLRNDPVVKLSAPNTTWDAANANQLLDIHGGTDPEWVMRSTRLMCSKFADLGEGEDGFHRARIGACASEVVNSVTMYRIFPDGSTRTWSVNSLLDMCYGPATNIDMLYDVLYSQTFSFFPILHIAQSSDRESSEAALLPLGNFDRTTTITPDNIEQLHEVATLGMFNVPRLTFGAVTKSSGSKQQGKSST